MDEDEDERGSELDKFSILDEKVEETERIKTEVKKHGFSIKNYQFTEHVLRLTEKDISLLIKIATIYNNQIPFTLDNVAKTNDTDPIANGNGNGSMLTMTVVYNKNVNSNGGDTDSEYTITYNSEKQPLVDNKKRLDNIGRKIHEALSVYASTTQSKATINVYYHQQEVEPKPETWHLEHLDADNNSKKSLFSYAVLELKANDKWASGVKTGYILREYKSSFPPYSLFRMKTDPPAASARGVVQKRVSFYANGSSSSGSGFLLDNTFLEEDGGILVFTTSRFSDKVKIEYIYEMFIRFDEL